MKDRLTRSVKGPAIIFGVVLALVVAIIALWNFVLVYDYVRLRDVLAREQEAYGGAFHWTFIAIGSVLLVAILVLLALMGTQLLAEIRFSQRQSSFIASVTHELNSPLSSIKLFAQTLQKTEIAPEERARFLGMLLTDVERLRSLIANILRQAQIDRDRLTLATETTPLREYLEDYIERRNATLKHEKPAESGGRTLVLLDGPDTDVEIDRTVFRQVLDNVVDNAFKFGKPSGVRVELQIRRAGPLSVALEVRDDGIGIVPTDLTRIFGRFGRAEETDPARARPGTGLGLSIVRAIVEAHEGKVEALSAGPGAGATIRIELPRAIGSTELHRTGNREGERMSRVLVVEDEIHLAEGLTFNLQNAGYEVRLARTAQEALDAAARERFDLVILDRMLPGGDGLEIARAVRRAKNYTPIVMLTARNQPEDRVAGLDAGADDYVTKPFDLDELLARVRGMLRRQAWVRAAEPVAAEEKRPAILEFGGSRIDFSTLKATTFSGDQIELSPKEAAIMRLFAEREGEVITRKLLLEEVWGETTALETRTTDNFILRLRKYFEPEPGTPQFILSVRGAGYRFVRGGEGGGSGA